MSQDNLLKLFKNKVDRLKLNYGDEFWIPLTRGEDTLPFRKEVVDYLIVHLDELLANNQEPYFVRVVGVDMNCFFIDICLTLFDFPIMGHFEVEEELGEDTVRECIIASIKGSFGLEDVNFKTLTDDKRRKMVA